jgi:chemotaxis protein histidine kinase CheA
VLNAKGQPSIAQYLGCTAFIHAVMMFRDWEPYKPLLQAVAGKRGKANDPTHKKLVDTLFRQSKRLLHASPNARRINNTHTSDSSSSPHATSEADEEEEGSDNEDDEGEDEEDDEEEDDDDEEEEDPEQESDNNDAAGMAARDSPSSGLAVVKRKRGTPAGSRNELGSKSRVPLITPPFLSRNAPVTSANTSSASKLPRKYEQKAVEEGVERGTESESASAHAEGEECEEDEDAGSEHSGDAEEGHVHEKSESGTHSEEDEEMHAEAEEEGEQSESTGEGQDSGVEHEEEEDTERAEARSGENLLEADMAVEQAQRAVPCEPVPCVPPPFMEQVAPTSAAAAGAPPHHPDSPAMLSPSAAAETKKRKRIDQAGWGVQLNDAMFASDDEEEPAGAAIVSPGVLHPHLVSLLSWTKQHLFLDFRSRYWGFHQDVSQYIIEVQCEIPIQQRTLNVKRRKRNEAANKAAGDAADAGMPKQKKNHQKNPAFPWKSHDVSNSLAISRKRPL